MISAFFLLATTISATTLDTAHHVPVSVTAIHDSVTTEVCSRAYLVGDSPYIVLDIELADDPASITLSVQGVKTLASSLSTPIGIAVKSQAAVDALVKREPVNFTYLMSNGKDSVIVSSPADPDLNCK
jgi:hypothetical protein